MTGTFFHRSALHAFRALKRSPLIFFCCILSLALCLLFLSFSWIAMDILRNHLSLSRSHPRAWIFLHDEASPRDQETLVARLRQWPEVTRVHTVYGQCAENGKGTSNRISGGWGSLGGSPGEFSARIEVCFETGENSDSEIDAVASRLTGMPHVSQVIDWGTLRERVDTARSFFGWAGIAAFGAFSLLTLFISCLTIRLNSSMCHEELAIAEILGAAPFQMRFPYYLQAVGLGIVASILCHVIFLFLLCQLELPELEGNRWIPHWNLSHGMLFAGATVCWSVLLCLLGCRLAFLDEETFGN